MRASEQKLDDKTKCSAEQKKNGNFVILLQFRKHCEFRNFAKFRNVAKFRNFEKFPALRKWMLSCEPATVPAALFQLLLTF